VNRLENKTGVCKSGRLARVTSAFTHFGEVGLSAWLERLGDDLFRVVQSAVRLLPEL
jgi:hypothetical protein